MFKVITEGKSVFLCDVCEVKLKFEDKINVQLRHWFNDKTIDLCMKHGKVIKKVIKKMKNAN